MDRRRPPRRVSYIDQIAAQSASTSASSSSHVPHESGQAMPPRVGSPGGGNAKGGRRRRRSSVKFGDDPDGGMMQTLRRGGGKVANGVARWFGVSGDQEEARYRHMQYEQHVAKEKRGEPNAKDSDEGDQAESSSDDSDFDPDKHDFHMIHNVDEGLMKYRVLRDEENRKIVKPGWFGGKVNTRRESLIDMGLQRRKSVHRRTSRVRRDTFVRAQLEAMPTYRPIFIELITAAQFILFAFVMVYAYTKGELAPFGLNPLVTNCTAATSPPCETFNGSLRLGSESILKRNFMYGPKESFIAGMGAKYTPCMRDDVAITTEARRIRAEECGPNRNNPCETGTGYGCCTLPSGRKGMTSQQGCAEADPLSTWTSDLCEQGKDFIFIRPCCGVPNAFSCQILSENECDFLGGAWQTDKILCSQTLCLESACQMTGTSRGITPSELEPNVAANPNQWWRFILPLFFHAGVIQAVIMLPIQFYAGRQIEKQAGALRTILIYFITGIGGTVIAAIFSPYQIGVGCDPAVYGLVACLLVELFQTWQIVEKPWLEFAKLSFVIIFLLLLGTTPYSDNWAHIGGFTFGIFSGIVFLPYITFGEWDIARKRLLVFICFPILFVMFIMEFVAFYIIQNNNFCPRCHYLNCIPYSPAIDCSLSFDF
eukprot:m.89238 g.89238  ORF g.89238 m.89238 type:complete len:653 (+) comp12886_c0_seq1:39-1997(+)